MACLIPCWGSSQWVIYIGSQKFTWNFLLAEVAFPILVADFLEKFNLLVDLYGSQLIDGDTGRMFHLSSLAGSGVFAFIGVANTIMATSSSTPFQALHLQALHLQLYISGSSQQRRWTTLRSWRSSPSCLMCPSSFRPSNMMWSTILRRKAGHQQPSIDGVKLAFKWCFQ